MIRILAFVLCLLPVSAFGAVYDFVGTGTCYFDDTNTRGNCSALYRLEINNADLGGPVEVTQSSRFAVFRGTEEVFFSRLAWSDDVSGVPGVCVDTCVEAETSPGGDLLTFDASCFYCPETTAISLAGWGFINGFKEAFQGSGTWGFH